MSSTLHEALLGHQLVRINANPVSKADAIRQAGQLLVAAGCVTPEFAESMIKREAVAETYLGANVAIPHGLGEDKHLVKQDGIAVLQVPGGLEWNPGQTVRLVVAIAARSDNHITILRRLTRLIQNEATLAALFTTGDAQTIISSTKALIEAASSGNIAPRIVQLSTMSVYGSSIGVVDEASPLRGDLGAYSEAKVAAEALAAGYPRVVTLRPGCVFGPGSEQWTVRYARLLLARRLGDLGSAGDGYCNLVHVGDVVQAVVRAIEKPQVDGRVFNLAVPEALTWNDFMVRFAMALSAVPVRRIGARRLRIEGKLLAPPLKILEIFAGKLGLRRPPPPIPPSLLRLMAQGIRLDSRRAQEELGVRFKDPEQMLTEAAKWYLSSA